MRGRPWSGNASAPVVTEWRGCQWPRMAWAPAVTEWRGRPWSRNGIGVRGPGTGPVASSVRVMSAGSGAMYSAVVARADGRAPEPGRMRAGPRSPDGTTHQSPGNRSCATPRSVLRPLGIERPSDRTTRLRPRSHRPRHAIAARNETGLRRDAPRRRAPRLRSAEPAPERLSAFLHDRHPWGDPDPGAPPPQGADPPGHEHLAVPVARRRPPRPGLRERRLPDAPLQPVRLLRGRADARVTSASVSAEEYREALAALAARGRFGIRLGLGRTRALLRELGDPQLGLRGALVAGTNGKGSVLALAASALRAAGLKVGETPKPHLVTYRERIQVDGHPISPADFTRHVRAVLAVADKVARRHGQPTEFELLTAVVFRHFAEVDVDVAMVEVGLGGRLDATHAWDGGVAVVTNVALDHMDRLGPTIPLIAREKAAIIERGDLAVTGADNEALPVIRRRARRVGAPLTEVGTAPLLRWDRDGIDVELPRLGTTRVALRGRHQAANVAVADATLDALEAAGIVTADAAARRTGYATATWPGRL